MKSIIAFFVFASITVQAQFVSISGVVKDGMTDAALPFASISLYQKPLGTIANAEGKFTLYIPAKFVNDTLSISSIGYQSLLIPLKNISRTEPGVFVLQPTTYHLTEVVVTDSLSAQVILRRAYENLKSNYPTRPFSLRGFYREIQKADSQYVSLLEASVKLYSDGYRTGRTERLQVDHLRRSLTYEHPLNSFWNTKNLLFHHLHQNFVKYASKMLIKFDRAYRKPNTAIGTTPVYVVVIQDKNMFWPAILYIREDNYAIIRAEEDFLSSRDGERSWKVDGAPLITSCPQHKLLRVDFQEHEGKYYVSNHYLEFTTQYKSSLTKDNLLLYSIVQQFAVTELDEVPQVIEPEVALKETQTLSQLTLPYDSAFWEHYTIVSETPLDSIVRRDLEQRIKVHKK